MGVLEVDKRVNRAEAIVENIGTKNVKKLSNRKNIHSVLQLFNVF